MGSYVPSEKEARRAMLDVVGVESTSQFYRAVPDEVLLDGLDIPDGLGEFETARLLEQMAAKNTVFSEIYRGAGAYDHYIPALVKRITSKESFLTAYTPYQAEVSQGILQIFFEYQTEIAELMGMFAANASLYDGANAAAEAFTMTRDRKKHKCLIPDNANPMTIDTCQTYADGIDAPLVRIPSKDGRVDLDALRELLSEEDVAGVYVQQPNYYGLVEDLEAIAALVHEKKAKLIVGMNPIAAAVLQSPGEIGADIAVGDGQPLGLPLGFGGPYLGFIACTEKQVRHLPGRIVGETVDADGNRAFVLTLQTREQHIRREKASSNVCTNHALCALTATSYMTIMGARGMADVAKRSMSEAHYLAHRLSALDGFSLAFDGVFFHEFVTKVPGDPKKLLAYLEAENILGGQIVTWQEDGKEEEGILWCCTEKNHKAGIDHLVALLEKGESAWN